MAMQWLPSILNLFGPNLASLYFHEAMRLHFCHFCQISGRRYVVALTRMLTSPVAKSTFVYLFHIRFVFVTFCTFVVKYKFRCEATLPRMLSLPRAKPTCLTSRSIICRRCTHCKEHHPRIYDLLSTHLNTFEHI